MSGRDMVAETIEHLAETGKKFEKTKKWEDVTIDGTHESPLLRVRRHCGTIVPLVRHTVVRAKNVMVAFGERGGVLKLVSPSNRNPSMRVKYVEYIKGTEEVLNYELA